MFLERGIYCVSTPAGPAEPDQFVQLCGPLREEDRSPRAFWFRLSRGWKPVGRADCEWAVKLPPPPTASDRAGLFFGPELAYQQLTAGVLQRHAEVVVTAVAFGRNLGHRNDQRIVCWLGHFRHDLTWRRQGRVNMRGDDILDRRRFKRNMP